LLNEKEVSNEYERIIIKLLEWTVILDGLKALNMKIKLLKREETIKVLVKNERDIQKDVVRIAFQPT